MTDKLLQEFLTPFYLYDEDIIKKLYQDLKDKNISENDVREKLNELLQTAKKDFL